MKLLIVLCGSLILIGWPLRLEPLVGTGQGTTAYIVSVPTPPGTLVDIGGQRLHLNCTGRGSPTVLLESGTEDLSVIWSLVQPGLHTFTPVSLYHPASYPFTNP